MGQIDFITQIHKKTKRNYVERVTQYDKAECASVAKQFGYEYWDGDRKYGYGGYSYDGRWKPVAESLIKHYNLKPGDKVLDVGCGKAFLLYELKQLIDGLEVTGIDISEYAIQHSKEEIKPYLRVADATQLPFEENTFDFVFSITTLHNLYIYDLKKALTEINRVKKDKAYLVVESYRNEREKANLLYWQLTCECFYTVKEWEWFYNEFGYDGDYSFIYFE